MTMKKVLLFAVAFVLSMGAMAQKDSTVYEAKGENGYLTIENNWLYTVAAGNFGTADATNVNNPAPASAGGGDCRSIAAKDGLIYAPSRYLANHFVIYNAETGVKIDTLQLSADVFTYEKFGWDSIAYGPDSIVNDTIGAGMKTYPTGMPMQDAAFDNAGNLLVCNLAVNMCSSPFQVWNINTTDGTGEAVIDFIETDPDVVSLLGTIRFDAFAVYGDINEDAIIMGAIATKATVAKWTIEGGELVDEFPEYIEIAKGDLYPSSILDLGTAPRVYIADENNFYVDGKDSYPTLFNMDGTQVDGFHNDTVDNAIATLDIKGNMNGLCEFNINDDYFLAMINTGAIVDGGAVWNSTFEIFKFADENRSFSEIEHLWSVPASFTGGKNAAFIANLVADVNQSTGVAKLYFYSSNQALGCYTITGAGVSEVEDITEFYEVANSESNVTITGEMTAIYHDWRNLYVQDADTFMLIHSEAVNQIDPKFVNGQIISNVVGKYSLYNDAAQMVLDTIETLGEVGAPVQPAVMAVADIKASDVHKYIKIENAVFADAITFEKGTSVNGAIECGEGTMTVRNNFRDAIEGTYAKGDLVNIVGFVAVYKGVPQVYPISITISTSVDNVEGSSLVVYNNGDMSEMAASVEVYSATGALVLTAKNTNRIQLDNSGLYIVKTVDMDGKVATTRIIVK